jgi:4-hydroxy-4-methyl-2-oxoglutarate aldolase
MPSPLTRDDLEALARISAPALANAIETFGLRPNNTGFAGPEIRALFPDLGPVVGFACTLRVAAERPPERKTPGAPLAYWEYVARSPGPKVIVVQDLDPHPAGAFWGEVNANVHKALGAAGTITLGGVRDLEEVRRTGFKAFASAVLVSHAYVHVEEFGGPVQLGRLTVQPGDLVYADQHGALVVPAEVARDLPRVAQEIERLEREIIDCARSAEFTPARLAEVWNGAVGRWPKPAGRPRGEPEVP